MEETSVTQQERNWGMLTHLSALIGLLIPFGNFVGPLVVWMIKKEEYSFVDDQGKESLNFQISFLLYMIIGLVLAGVAVLFALMFVDFWLLIVAALFGLGFVVLLVYWLVIVIVASLRASNGQLYRYPLNVRFIK